MNAFTKMGHLPKVMLLVFVAMPALLAIMGGAQAQNTTCIRFLTSPNRYIEFDSDNHIQGSVPLYDNSSCTDNANTERITTPSGGWIFVTSEEDALEMCQRKYGSEARVSEETRSVTIDVWRCSRPRRSRSRPTPTPKPFVATGLLLNQTDLRLSARGGPGKRHPIQRLDAPGVGIPGVIAMGLLDAVDVWGIIKGSYTVCFPQSGIIYFLDAANAPRTAVRIAAFTDGDFTCGTMNRAGTLALVQGDGHLSVEAATQDGTRTGALGGPTLDDSVEIRLSNCEVTTLVTLRHRNGPAGGIIGVAPAQTTLEASARTDSWFKVTLDGRDGWIAAWLTDAEGDCDYPLAVG